MEITDLLKHCPECGSPVAKNCAPEFIDTDTGYDRATGTYHCSKCPAEWWDEDGMIKWVKS